MEDYYGFIESNNPIDTEDEEPYIEYTDIIKNCPRLLRPFQIKIDNAREPITGNLLQLATINNPGIEIVEINSLSDLEAKLVNCYQYDDCTTTTEINIDMLTRDLISGKIFYKINSEVYSQICDFKFMNKLLLKPQKDVDETPSIPYNKCLAMFMVMYYMRCNYLCTEFLKNTDYHHKYLHEPVSLISTLLPSSLRCLVYCKCCKMQKLYHPFHHINKSFLLSVIYSCIFFVPDILPLVGVISTTNITISSNRSHLEKD